MTRALLSLCATVLGYAVGLLGLAVVRRPAGRDDAAEARVARGLPPDLARELVHDAMARQPRCWVLVTCDDCTWRPLHTRDRAGRRPLYFCTRWGAA